MRLHHFIELFSNSLKYAKINYPERNKLFNDLNDNILKTTNVASQVDVGDLLDKINDKEIKDLIEYSTQLKANGLEISPHPITSISYRDSCDTIIIAKEQGSCVEILNSKINSDKTGVANLLMITAKFDEDGTVKIKSGWAFPAHGEDNSEDFLKSASLRAVNAYCCVCSIMNSHNTEIITTPAPKRLNEKRAKKGKPPIGEIKEIRINYGGKRYMIDGSEEGGTHASPRLHWRRGHVRRLASGKITNVRPTLVGAIKGEEPKMPVYKITNTKERQFDDKAESSKERKQTDCRLHNSNGAECGRSVAHQRALETEVGD